MSFQTKYRTYAAVRDAVIDKIIPENEKEEITQVMRSIELALIATDKGKKMTVTREGTEVFELYIRYLERRVFNLEELSIKTPKETFFQEIECPKCKGARYINQQVKKKRVPTQCTKCKGTGMIKKEKECG